MGMRKGRGRHIRCGELRAASSLLARVIFPGFGRRLLGPAPRPGRGAQFRRGRCRLRWCFPRLTGGGCLGREAGCRGLPGGYFSCSMVERLPEDYYFGVEEVADGSEGVAKGMTCGAHEPR